MKPKLKLLIACAVVAMTIPAAAYAAKKPKQPKLPSQSPITVHTCITVHSIYSYGHGFFSGVAGRHEPGLEAKISNQCRQLAHVFLRVGYFDGKGNQFGHNIISADVAPGADYSVDHVATTVYQNGSILKSVRVIGVDAYPGD